MKVKQLCINSYKPPVQSQNWAQSLFLNLYRCNSQQISRHLHRLKVNKVVKGGQSFIFGEEKVGLAVGVKGSCYNAGGEIVRRARKYGFGTVVLSQNELNLKETSQVISGLIQANYKYKLLGDLAQEKQQSDENNDQYSYIQELYVQENIFEDPYFQQLVQLAQIKLYARDLANTRQEGTPQYFVNEVKKLFKDNPNVEIQILEGKQLQECQLNLFYAVGQGSIHPPTLINLTYRGNKNSQELHALVGKGITFDTGGLHLKSYGHMENMYLDKSGACNVLAAFKGAVDMKLKVNVTITLGMAENAISNTSYKPSNILKSHKGLTVEINNTDAEGRLVLADCLSWTQAIYNPTTIVEISTLTGSCKAALGENTGGLFSNNDKLSQELLEIGKELQEPFWRMPVTDEHQDMMKGKFADLCNTGKSKICGASKAAAFLFNFVDDKIPFAHLDIAGPKESKTDKGIYPLGATGFGTQVLLKYLLNKQE
ncbi:unnamed protein product [Paramecium primaurelia]|uniref:Cytosol aminopeptidase domain-containing protein n=1 Tax=Paramecium primaurelia TaxID=5886 RepID=A0A8S1PJA8_PARPR|nr:unnamed protein product [Paramecium primaurelia]